MEVVCVVINKHAATPLENLTNHKMFHPGPRVALISDDENSWP